MPPSNTARIAPSLKNPVKYENNKLCHENGSMTPKAHRSASATADYYNDHSVSKFYESCWGGSDIHIGLYKTGKETIAEASAAMTRHLLNRCGVQPGQSVLDIACGFGGTLRTLARMGCRAKGIDISQVCVDGARRTNAAAGLTDEIDVTVGDFHNIESDDDAWDAVVCQEALIHSPDRSAVFAEVFRVLRPGGKLALSDILTAEGANISMVESAFARLGAAPGATARDYQDMARGAGFNIVHMEERPEDIQTHYAKLADRLAEPIAGFDPEAARSILKSIVCWQAALAGGHITWACFMARKPD
jgi:sarcosine/dimethylglycine N-methyltransferase